MTPPLRIAAWSGPRNISTAMMRAWENRDDCAVVDEPLYAHYLHVTRLDHPARDEVIAAGETDWRRAVDALTLGAVPGGRAIWYQKHMSHHLLPHIETGWVHPTINQQFPDPDCDLDYVPNTSRNVGEVNVVLKNSFGFGGQNACIVLKKYES